MAGDTKTREAAGGERLLVLGGGLAGLAASYACGAPVYEAQAQPGGVAASDRREGFAFDRGIHVLQTRNARILELLEKIGVRLRGVSRRAYIYSGGVYTPYPFQVNTAGMPLALRARCVWDFLRRDRSADPRNYEEWIYANVGRGFADTFLIPYSEKFWTVHPREMTHEWTGNRVPQPSTLQVLRGALWSKQTRIGSNAEFRYPVSGAGYGAIAEALARRAGPVHTGHRATRIDLRARTVHFQNGACASYERLISTLPLPELVALCAEAPGEVRAAAAKLRTNSILVVNLAVGRAGLTDWHWVHFPARDISFFRVSFPHNFADNTVPPGASAVSAEVAYRDGEPLDKGEMVRRVIDDLVRVRILRREDPILFSMTHDIRYAYCIYDFERKAAVRALREWLARFGVVPAGRYGRWSYFWSDEAMMSGLQTGERLLKEMNGHGAPERIALAG